jgi:hypothetical protein
VPHLLLDVRSLTHDRMLKDEITIENVLQRQEERLTFRYDSKLDDGSAYLVEKLWWARDVIKTTVYDLTAEYDAAVRREVCTRMCVKLPRELRDIVYTHLIHGRVSVNNRYPGQPIVSFRHRKASPHAFDCTGRKIHDLHYFAKEPRTADDELCRERFWQEEATGAQVAGELVQTWYRATEFVIPWSSPLQFLSFIDVDRFDVGIHPASLITKVTREVAVRDMLSGRSGPHNSQDRTIEAFEALMDLGTQARVHVRFLLEVNPYSNDEDALEEVMAIIDNVVIDLMNEGLRVRASVEYPGVRTKESRSRMDKTVSDWVVKLQGRVKVINFCTKTIMVIVLRKLTGSQDNGVVDGVSGGIGHPFHIRSDMSEGHRVYLCQTDFLLSRRDIPMHVRSSGWKGAVAGECVVVEELWRKRTKEGAARPQPRIGPTSFRRPLG